METADENEKMDKSLMGFSRRTIEELKRAWRDLLGMTRRMITGKIHPDLPDEDQSHVSKEIYQCLFGKGGEVSCRAQAADLAMTYMSLSQTGRERFLNLLARDFQLKWDQIRELYEKADSAEDDEEKLQTQVALSDALVPPNIGLLKKFSSLPNGFKFLIDLRADLLPIRKDDPYLKKLDSDLKGVLSSWFDVGLLDLREITWQQSSAALLEKLIEYEAVHKIKSWQDLRNRLDSDRYCFAFFHYKIPDEPLIFVEVALTDRIPDSIHTVLDETAETLAVEKADTAVFYSISNTQRGLAGISLGNFLIKRVVRELTQKLDNLKHFVTLSPIPGFCRWLKRELDRGTNPVIKRLGVDPDVLNPVWVHDKDAADRFKPVLMKVCAHYLVKEKRGDKAKDPVANFHLTNGAYLRRINWLSDTSAKGLSQSLGIMANYYYDLDDIVKNHELYMTRSEIAVGKELKPWLK
jgi:malonyl-CoA decarboxylase